MATSTTGFSAVQVTQYARDGDHRDRWQSEDRNQQSDTSGGRAQAIDHRVQDARQKRHPERTEQVRQQHHLEVGLREDMGVIADQRDDREHVVVRGN
jgi:hypothetical protein